jgi:hypothetical protein
MYESHRTHSTATAVIRQVMETNLDSGHGPTGACPLQASERRKKVGLDRAHQIWHVKTFRAITQRHTHIMTYLAMPGCRPAHWLRNREHSFFQTYEAILLNEFLPLLRRQQTFGGSCRKSQWLEHWRPDVCISWTHTHARIHSPIGPRIRTRSYSKPAGCRHGD